MIAVLSVLAKTIVAPDQRIAYYHPNIRSFRTWFPMCIQIVSLVRNNSYMIHRTNAAKPMSQKNLTMEMIDVLMNEAEFYQLCSPCIYETMPNVVELSNSNSCTSLSTTSPSPLLSRVRNRSLRSSNSVKSWNHLSSNDVNSPKRILLLDLRTKLVYKIL